MLCDTKMLFGPAAQEMCLNEAIAEQTERRRLHRKPFLRKATISAWQDEMIAQPAFCRDISRDGIGLLHEVPLEPGMEFCVTIPLVGAELEIECEANWCQQVGKNQYFSGNAYQAALTPQSLLLISAALSQELNRRLQRRYTFVRPAVFEGSSGHEDTVFSRDISQVGIGFVHRHELPLGPSQVVIQLSSDASATLQVDVRRCTPLSNNWYASGARFVE